MWADCRLQPADATSHERWQREDKGVAGSAGEHFKPGGWRYLLQRGSSSSEAAVGKRHSLLLTADLDKLTCKHLYSLERWATTKLWAGASLCSQNPPEALLGSTWTGSVIQVTGWTISHKHLLYEVCTFQHMEYSTHSIQLRSAKKACHLLLCMSGFRWLAGCRAEGLGNNLPSAAAHTLFSVSIFPPVDSALMCFIWKSWLCFFTYVFTLWSWLTLKVVPWLFS